MRTHGAMHLRYDAIQNIDDEISTAHTTKDTESNKTAQHKVFRTVTKVVY